MRFMQENLARSYTVQTNDGAETVHTLTSPRKVVFPGERRRRTTYRFDFADQHVVPESVEAAAASTFFCLDSRSMTRALRIATILGLTPRLSRLHPETFASVMSSLPLGSDRYSLLVSVKDGASGQTVQAGVSGRGEAHATGVITGMIGHRLHQGRIPTGVHHLEEVVAFDELIEELTGEGITVHIGGNRAHNTRQNAFERASLGRTFERARELP